MITPFRRLLHKWFGETRTGTYQRSHTQRRTPFFRPVLDHLEDRLAPAAVSSVSTSGLAIIAGAGNLQAGQIVHIAVNFDADVSVDTSIGFPSLALNDGATAAYAGTTGTTGLKFTYTVAGGQNTSDLTVTALNLNGAIITDTTTTANADVSGAAANPTGILQIDTIAPTVSSLTQVGAVDQNDGSVLHYAVTFSELVGGVGNSSFNLTTNGVAGASISSVTPGIDAAHYTVNVASGSVDSGTGTGTIGIKLTGANIKDLAGNGLVNGPLKFANHPGVFSGGAGTVSVAIGDLNDDGIADIVTANSNSNNVGVKLGTGNGSFSDASGSPIAVGNSPLAVAIGDVNGDLIPDLVVANSGDNSVSVLLGTGNGTFLPANIFSVGTLPDAVAIADLNVDGKPDLVVANRNSNNVSVLLGTGGGSFGSATNFSVGTNPYSVAIAADLNGDGIPDIVTANRGSNNVSVLLGTGTGSFGSPTNFAVGSLPVSVAVADINNDGKLDIAAANYFGNSISVLLGTGTGSFSAATGSPFGTGATSFLGGAFPLSVAIGDVNGDGKLDLATANSFTNNASVLLGDGAGSFSAAPSSPFSAGTNSGFVAIGDINGDGRLDLVAANGNFNQTVNLLTNAFLAQTAPSFTLHDTTGPTLIVNDGTGVDVDFQAYMTSIAANWIGVDAGSGIASYKWAIGTTPGGTNVQAYTNIAIKTPRALNSLLTLTEGKKYYVSVRATDHAGNTSTVTSDGVTVVPTASFLTNNVGTFTDSDGDRYTVQLTPSNIGRVAVKQTITSPGKGPIQWILVQNTDPTKSVLTITVVHVGAGNGLVRVGAIQVLGGAAQPLGLGGLKSIVAPKVDLAAAGNVTVGGTATQATSISLHDIGAAAIYGGSMLTLTAHNIANGATITDNSKLASLTAANFGTASIVAPSLGTLKITGDFSGNVTLSGIGVPEGSLTLAQVIIGGTVHDSVLNVAGNVGSFKAMAFVNSQLRLGLTSVDPQNLMNSSALSNNYSLTSFEVTGATAAFSNSLVAASNITTVTLQSVDTNNAGKKFGILVHGTPNNVDVFSPDFHFDGLSDPLQLTPKGIGDFQVLDDQRGFSA